MKTEKITAKQFIKKVEILLKDNTNFRVMSSNMESSTVKDILPVVINHQVVELHFYKTDLADHNYLKISALSLEIAFDVVLIEPFMNMIYFCFDNKITDRYVRFYIGN